MNETDESYMREALHLAEFARGRTSPNPLVGALIVRDGTVVASGWHRAARRFMRCAWRGSWHVGRRST